MHRIDKPSAVAVLPSPSPVGTPGFFTEGNPLLSIPPTVVSGDWANAVQEELSAVVEAAGLTLDKGDPRQVLQALGRLAGGSLNLVLNPEGLWRQIIGANPALGSTEILAGPDHWWAKAGGVGDVAELTGGQGGASIQAQLAGAKSSVRTRMRFQKTVNAATGINPTVRQSMEDVVTFNGKQVVLAFDAIKNPSGGPPDLAVVGAEVVQDFGTGGSPSADVTTPLTSIGALVIDGSWRRFVFTGALPSILGKTLGSFGGGHLKVRVKFAADQLFDVFLTGFTFTLGQVDPGYQMRPAAVDLELVRRYIESSIDNAAWGNFTEDMESGLWDTGFAGAGKVRTLNRRFRVEKYAVGSGSVAVTRWFAHDGTADAITEDAATVHPVETNSRSLGEMSDTHTGPPEITTPPLLGTLRVFRAYYHCLAEIPD